MNLKSAHAPVVILLAQLLAACGGSGSQDEASSDTTTNVGNGGCIDRSIAVGIEGGGFRRLLGEITSIGNDGTVRVGCQRVVAEGAVILIDGVPATVADLQVGQVVEILGSIDPESGDLNADSIIGKVPSGSHGHYVGTVTIGGIDYFGDALVTVDGAIRLYVGGPYSDTGVLQLTRPETSAQVVGNLRVQGNAASGTGIIIGERCAAVAPIRFCNDAASAEINVLINEEALRGEIQVNASAGEESWSLDLRDWSHWYLGSADPQYLAGQYQEALAEFNVGADMIISIDPDGSLFFQSAPSSCVANGSFAAHLDGNFNVYDLELTLESCTGSFAYLNGVYDGFATSTPGAYWDYTTLLVVWLAKPDAASPAALTLYAMPLYSD
jgi:hypothetical protein